MFTLSSSCFVLLVLILLVHAQWGLNTHEHTPHIIYLINYNVTYVISKWLTVTMNISVGNYSYLQLMISSNEDIQEKSIIYMNAVLKIQNITFCYFFSFFVFYTSVTTRPMISRDMWGSDVPRIL